MVHELDYFHWAARSARTHDWVQATYGEDPETLAWLTEAAAWPQLVTADPALHHQGETGAEDAVPEILAPCAPRPEGPALAAPDHQPETQREATADLVARIHAELDGRLAGSRPTRPRGTTTSPNTTPTRPIAARQPPTCSSGGPCPGKRAPTPRWVRLPPRGTPPPASTRPPTPPCIRPQ